MENIFIIVRIYRSLRLTSNIDRAIMDCGYLLMALGESNFLALATAESSVYVGDKKIRTKTVPPLSNPSF